MEGSGRNDLATNGGERSVADGSPRQPLEALLEGGDKVHSLQSLMNLSPMLNSPVNASLTSLGGWRRSGGRTSGR